jgi:hypothetical protein
VKKTEGVYAPRQFERGYDGMFDWLYIDELEILFILERFGNFLEEMVV